MPIKNPWTGYLTRGYQQIKDSVVTRLKTLTPEITDYSESNILMIIVGIFAGIAEQLGYYIDNMAREAFISTVRRFSNMLKLVKLISYKVRASVSATVEITFVAVNASGDPVTLGTGLSIEIPVGTMCSTDAGVTYYTTRLAYIVSGQSAVIVPARQRVLIQAYSLGASPGGPNQNFVLPSNYEHYTESLEVNSILWERRDYLDLSGPLDKHYMIEVKDDGLPYVIFGDGVNGLAPIASDIIVIDYFETLGQDGKTDPHTITTLDSSLTIPSQTPAISEIQVFNEFAAVGGLPIEGLEEVRRNSILSLRTLDRAVTRQDYIDITKLAPGVGKAALYFECAKEIEIYIAPVGGGIADQALLNSTGAYLEERKMVTTFIAMYPAGETYIGLSLEVKAKFRVAKAVCEAEIREALTEAYSSVNSDIDKPIRLSDIIALVDNLPKVDYLSVAYLYTIPYARPITNTLPELDWERYTMSGSLAEATWRVYFRYNSGVDPYFDFYRNNIFIQSIQWDDPLTNLGNMNILQARINSITGLGASQDGGYWIFKTYPYNQNIELDDFSVPVMIDSYLDITVSEQLFVTN